MNIKQQWLPFLLMLNFFSCSQLRGQKVSQGEGVPEWIYSPGDACQEQVELCASGEGESVYLADLNARKALASIFETHIDSEVTSSSQSEGTLGMSDVKLQEEMNIELSEKVDVVLEGVEIKQRHQAEEIFFSLAVLDKATAWNKLKKQIEETDEKLVELAKRRKRSTLKKMYALYELRSQLNERFIFLRGKPLKDKVSLSDIKEIQYGQSSTIRKIAFEIESDFSQNVVESLETILTGFGHQVVKENDLYEIKIEGKLTPKKEYLNVEGFQKFSFSLYLATKNRQGTKIGGLSFKDFSVGRSEKDAYLKIESKMKEYLEEHIDELNID